MCFSYYSRTQRNKSSFTYIVQLIDKKERVDTPPKEEKKTSKKKKPPRDQVSSTNQKETGKQDVEELVDMQVYVVKCKRNVEIKKELKRWTNRTKVNNRRQDMY